MRNERGFAVHLLSIKSSEWPPSGWNESELYRDKETRLPTQLFPFSIDRDIESGQWYLAFRGEKAADDRVLQSGFENIFAAWRAMFDAYEAWFPTRPVSRIYFIGTHLRVGRLVKIGVSRAPERRLAQLQTGHGERLQIFAAVPGDENDEAKYHRRWHARRRQGEWFTLGDCIIKEIERLRSLTPFRRSGDGVGR